MFSQNFTIDPLSFWTILFIEAALMWYGIVRYKAFKKNYPITEDVPMQECLVLNNYDDQFVDIAYKIGKLRTAQDFDNATKCIQIFQDTYKPHPDHQQWVVENDVNVLLSLLNARLESLQNDGLPIYV